MHTIKLLRNEVSNYVDISYFVKFFLLFLSLYYFNNFFVGVTEPGGRYFPFLADHLNYVSCIRYSIIHTANLIAHAIGMKSYVGADFTLYNSDGTGVCMGWACAGLGVMSFWLSFVVADKMELKKKVLWALSGMLVIWLINCLRVTLILVALFKKWEDFNNMDHHQFFNICSYVVLLTMIFIYTKKNSKNRTV